MKIHYKFGAYYASAGHDPEVMKRHGWLKVKDGWRTARIERVAPFVDSCEGEAATRVRTFVDGRLAAIADSILPTADVEIPVGARALAAGKAFRGYQKAASVFQRARHTSLNGDIPRAGKSVTSIGCINMHEHGSISRVLIVCPANAKIGWCKHWRDWSVHFPDDVDYVEGSANPKSPCLVVNWDVIARHVDYLRSVDWDIIIPDEMHRLGNAQSGRTRALLGCPIPRGSLRASKHWLFLSGNPIGTRPRNLFPFLKFADPHGLGKNEWKFWQRYCDLQYDGFGWNADGASNMEELQFELRKRLMIRREKNDIGTFIPPARETVRLPAAGLSKLVKAERNAVQANLADFERLLATSATDDTMRAKMNSGVAIPAAVQDLALAALPMMTKFITEQLELEPKVVVFAYHRAVMEQLRQAFPDCAYVIGGLSTTQREAERIRFQEDPACHIFVGNIAACCENMELSAADVAIFCELSWQHWQLDQCEERIWLPTKTAPLQIYRLVVEGSASADMADLIVQAQDSIERITSAQRLTAAA